MRLAESSCFLPILLVKKSRDGIKFCIDYKKLNALTKKDAYSILLIIKTLAQLKKAKVFTKIDIRRAFYKFQMAAESENLTTMAMRFEASKWKVLLFELTNSSASWQCFINNVLEKYLNKFCTAYLDDILIYSSNFYEHKKHVQLVLIKL